MGLKKADPSRLKEVLPKKERSLDAEVMKSHIQKLRSFRYQMKSTLAGDNLDTAEELAQKGILANGELGLSVERHRNGSISLTRGLSENGDGVMMETEELREAFEVPREFASAIERVDGPQMKRSVELMGQCVQVQRSAHGVLLHAIETQDNLKSAIMDKVRRMGLPAVSSTPGISGTGQASGHPSGASIAGGGSGASGSDNSSVTSLWAGQSKPSLAGSSSLSPTDGSGGGGATLSGGIRKGLGAYAGVASMLQASAQSMQGPPLPQRRGLPVSANLFSFVPTPGAVATGDTNQNANTNSLGLPPGAPEITNAAAPGAPGSGAPAAAATAPGAAAATRLASVADGVGGFSGGGVRLGLGLDAAGDGWESGILDGAGGGGMLEALDETSLRMEMQTSMDMHRLMRSRQKNQIQLHAQQERQRQQQGDVEEGEGGTEKGESGGSSGNTNAKKTSSSTSGSGEFPVPASRSGLGRASGAPVAPGTQVATSLALATKATGGGNGSSSAARAGGAALLAAPPPGRGGGGGAEAVPGSGSSSSSSGGGGANGIGVTAQHGGATPRSDGDTPTLMNADWNWDVDTLDEQLFSFLLDTPPST